MKITYKIIYKLIIKLFLLNLEEIRLHWQANKKRMIMLKFWKNKWKKKRKINKNKRGNNKKKIIRLIWLFRKLFKKKKYKKIQKGIVQLNKNLINLMRSSQCSFWISHRWNNNKIRNYSEGWKRLKLLGRKSFKMGRNGIKENNKCVWKSLRFLREKLSPIEQNIKLLIINKSLQGCSSNYYSNQENRNKNLFKMLRKQVHPEGFRRFNSNNRQIIISNNNNSNNNRIIRHNNNSKKKKFQQ